MYVVDFEREEVVNMDNIVSFFLDRADIYAKVLNGNEILMGRYPTKERAKEVFNKLLSDCFPPNLMVAHNCSLGEIKAIERQQWDKTPLFVSTKGEARIERFDIGVYYMPEE